MSAEDRKDAAARAGRQVTVAVDGPSGAGKGTVGKRVAHRLHYQYIDTGAMYRAVALAAQRQGVELTDGEGVTALAEALPIRFAPGEPPRVVLDGEDITRLIRSERCGNGASFVSQIPGVRAGLVARQRAMGARGGVVMDGRDIGTVVFPGAEVKIFLTADTDQRVARRVAQLEERGEAVDPERVRAELEERDHRDRTRATSPLRQADDAVVVDTSHMTIDEVVEQVVGLVLAAEQAGGSGPEKG